MPIKWKISRLIYSTNFPNIYCRGGENLIRTITIRDGTEYEEIFEVKREFAHPLYIYPKFYNDIGILELGNQL